LKLLAIGATLALSGCARTVNGLSRQQTRHDTTSSAPSPPASIPAVSATTIPPVELGKIPPAHPGAPIIVSSGPPGNQEIALTVDDGYCGSCIAQFIEFAEESGIHMTFNPNGAFGSLWTPPIVAVVQEMVESGQVQFGNHTWDHANLLGLSNAAIASEISRNEDWIEQTFGVTARPYFRPPYGYYNRRVIGVAANLGYTSILLWNGTFGDATLETPQQIIGLAEQWLQPGTIMLGHLNHPPTAMLLSQIEAIIVSRNLDPVTLDEMFGTTRTTG
jgi:peptidoglycan/xylan/chitin deacetylase (PgdA/CDA1 family)